MGFLSVVRKLLLLAVAIVVILAGAIKLTPAIDLQAHVGQVAKFELFRSTLPLPYNDFGITADLQRQVVGIAEVVCGLLLFTPLATLSNILLILIMAGAVLSEQYVGRPFTAPAAVAGVLVLALILPRGTSRPEEAKAKSSQQKQQKQKKRQ
eukprot:TRINITY_DN5790_c0_g1_i2.p1 TRINITY_DN5790_c0_g1~~TRINITY_DN5790_c0_g1_i2.p1  ORF type:complete len:152 (-),score=14.80 TRINITY_DN5790_c0_g1_i2:61-516(-)